MNTVAVSVKRSEAFSWTLDFLYAIAGSLFIALCAQISVAFPFTPVPFTFQAQAVLLTAYLLGPRRGFLAVCAYLLEGAFNVPVFAQGGFGWAVLLGPTGGYLISYLWVSYLVGELAKRNREGNRLLVLGIFLLASALIIVCGACWLSLYVGTSAAWTMGVVPFLISDALKISMLVLGLPLWRKVALWLN